jgi:hypothetical protein
MMIFPRSGGGAGGSGYMDDMDKFSGMGSMRCRHDPGNSRGHGGRGDWRDDMGRLGGRGGVRDDWSFDDGSDGSHSGS